MQKARWWYRWFERMIFAWLIVWASMLFIPDEYMKSIELLGDLIMRGVTITLIISLLSFYEHLIEDKDGKDKDE